MNEWLAKAGYVADPKHGVWHSPNYRGIAYNDGDAVEERIAAALDKTSDLTVFSLELRKHQDDWASFYHLSSSRANILRPYRDRLKGDILEIGAGCGAITRYLGECGANILALEGSMRRAVIARSRTRDLENVNVLAEEFDRFTPERRFDVITLIGVLEYANLFTPGESPHLTLLRRAKEMLKPDGLLLLAIENQLGLKYFAGAQEDHVGVPMYGIEGRYRTNQPQTFGRKTLSDMLAETGFRAMEFLLPFPDYKFPATILTPQGLAHPRFDAAALVSESVLRDPQRPPVFTFSPELVWPELITNDMCSDLANSFLVGASPKGEVISKALAYHYTTERAPHFCKETIFEGLEDVGSGITLTRRLLAPNRLSLSNDNLVDFVFDETESYTYGVPLSLSFIETVTKDGWTFTEFAKALNRYVDIIREILASLDKTSPLDSVECLLPGSFFDIVPQNIIIREDGSYVVIDSEWILKEDIELGHLLFRMLVLLIHSVSRLGHCGDAEEPTRRVFFERAFESAGFHLRDDDLNRYAVMDERIQAQIAGRKPAEFQEWPDAALQYRNLGETVLHLEQKLASLMAEANRTENMIEDPAKTTQQKDIIIAELSHQRDTFIAEIERASAAKTEQGKHLAQTQMQLSVTQASLAEVQAQLAAAILESTICDTHNVELLTQNDALSTKIKHISETYEKLTSDAQAKLADVQAQLATATNECMTSVSHNFELQLQVDALSAEAAHLREANNTMIDDYHKEQFTVVKPLYRNIYHQTGSLMRRFMPNQLVDRIRNYVPNPHGIPAKLTYIAPAAEKVKLADFNEVTPALSLPDIFIFSIIDWDFRTQRPQHIARELSRQHRVFYVEMNLSDGPTSVRRIDENLYCVRLSSRIGHIQPYVGKPTSVQSHLWMDEFYQLCLGVHATAFKHVIVQHPFWWQMLRHLSPEFRIVFDCMDDIGGFSNTEPFLIDLESEMIESCDRLVVSSEYLFEKYKAFNPPTLIRNAGQVEHFMEASAETPQFFKPNPHTEKSRKIRVGYVGAIAEWFDWELIDAVAKCEPDLEFHLCGAVTAEGPARLMELPNVTLYGEISYSDVPAFLDQMDVLIIPFKIIPLIQACDPVKFYEYSAKGKPTVTTLLPELQRASHLAFFASSPEEFAAQLRNAATKGEDEKFRDSLREYAAENTWRHRGEDFESLLAELPRVSIVILSYGESSWTLATLDSLFAGGGHYPNQEVLIVDNGSEPDALRDLRLAAESYPNVTLIENGENLGFARGNNVGVTAATGDYVLLLNNDTYVAPGAVHAMLRHLQHNPSIGVVGPLTNNIGNEAKLDIAYSDMNGMKHSAHIATLGFRGEYTPLRVVAYFAVMFRRSDLDLFGPLSEDYGRGMFEDDDHCEVIRSKGYTCALAEDAFVHHHLSATFSTINQREKQLLFEKNKIIFEDKWGPWQPHRYRTSRPLSTLTNRS